MSLALSIVLAGFCLLRPAPDWQAELERLHGHTVEVGDEGYQIIDIAGEGAPLVGCVRRDGQALVLETQNQRYRLTGPLAVPRIAGPNYKVWVIGKPTAAMTLPATRLGILATPNQSECGLPTAPDTPREPDPS